MSAAAVHRAAAAEDVLAFRRYPEKHVRQKLGVAEKMNNYGLK
jgi:hypothetical protein